MRKVTELELRRLVLGLDRPEMAVQLELCCEEGGGVRARALRRWEARLHMPYRLFRRALCTYLNVDSIAQLGMGDTLEAARWWTWMTPDERTAEVDRRQMLGLAANGTVVLLLPVSELTAAAQLLEGRPSVGAGDLATATRVATDIAIAYAAAPDADVIRSAKAHAYTLLDVLDRATMTVDTRTRLEAVASDAACLAGYGLLDNGRLAEADAWLADALELFDGALARTTAPVRRAGLHDNVTGACVALGEPDRACASAHAALDERDSYGIAGVTSWVRRARMTFPKPWATLQPVIELDERLALTS